MGEDRRQSDRRVGPTDRRLDSSEQFRNTKNSNISNHDSKKTYISLTTFIITIVVFLITTIVLIWLVYNNLNNKINELNYYDDEYLYDNYDNSDEDLYTDTDIDLEIDNDSDIITPDSDTSENITD